MPWAGPGLPMLGTQASQGGQKQGWGLGSRSLPFAQPGARGGCSSRLRDKQMSLTAATGGPRPGGLAVEPQAAHGPPHKSSSGCHGAEAWQTPPPPPTPTCGPGGAEQSWHPPHPMQAYPGALPPPPPIPPHRGPGVGTTQSPTSNYRHASGGTGHAGGSMPGRGGMRGEGGACGWRGRYLGVGG